MTDDQLLTLVALAGVVVALIWDRLRPDVVALAGSAVLLVTGVVLPSEVQGAFASPALIALASLFVIVYAIELSGVLDWLINKAITLCQRIGALGLWLTIALCGGASAFLNNTPIVVLAAPIIRDTAATLGLDPRRFLMPLSYIAILGGCCTLIGTSTNLLVADMARIGGQQAFGLFDITPVGLCVALAGGLYLLVVSPWLSHGNARNTNFVSSAVASGADAQVGDSRIFVSKHVLDKRKAAISVTVFIGTIVTAAIGFAPIAATAFAGAVLLILLRVINADEAYSGLRPQILLLIAGMVVVGIAMEESGLAKEVTSGLVGVVRPFGPLLALAVFYGVTLFLTEILSNATVAVLFAPIAIALAESLGVSSRPFLVAVMMAASAAFATPFGYQTNVIVYQLGGYAYTDFVRVGLPLNIITWMVGLFAISWFFPF
ncbi:MAG: SLC13 family permease [Sphingorhabdus sp.]|jgi:di/tricarboxylate transporter|uniref:SLC13 family permease n=1 Tax=Sphingorhabdus sp. TaxID=1902408 RepID=UPI00273EC4DC|nr:SLC13 family permease [Sphingorhabdus sp.]MDP4871874.1 SLC13 family permease [Sphingorhabdus sp.]